MLSEINPLDLNVISEFFRSAGSKNRPVVDDISAVSDLQGFSHVVVSDEHTNLLGFQMINDFLNLQHRNWIDPGKRLIQQNEFRRNDQRPRNLQSTPLAAGQGICDAFSNVADAEFLEQSLHPIASIFSRKRECFEYGHNVG